MQPGTTESPESTGTYECRACGNQAEFIGYDDHGFPGEEDCECGALEDGVNCVCQVTLKQPFTVLESGEVTYAEFIGGGFGSEGSYTRIQCALCDELIWRESEI